MFDPFAGTGSILVAAAHLGAVTLGADIDIRVLRDGKIDSSGKVQRPWTSTCMLACADNMRAVRPMHLGAGQRGPRVQQATFLTGRKAFVDNYRAADPFSLN